MRRAWLLLLLPILAWFLLRREAPSPLAPPPEPDRSVAERPAPPEMPVPEPVEVATASPGTPVPPAPAELPPGFFRSLSGTVRDVKTGNPIEGARVVYAGLSASGASWWGSGTGPEGQFTVRPGSDHDPTGEWFELRVVAHGYLTWRGNPVSAEMEIELDRLHHLPLPGRIRGRAVDRDGQPLSGVIEVVLLDETFSSRHQCALASEQGDFVLPGVPPGAWEVFLSWQGRWENAFVPEGGEVEIELRSRKSRAELSARSGRQGPERAMLYQRLTELERLRSGEADPQKKKRLEAEIGAIFEKIQEMEKARRGSRPTWQVRVTGIPGEFPALLTAAGRGQRWVAEVREGVAVFPALHAGEWRLTLISPEGKRIEAGVTVHPGEGPQQAKFSPR